MKHLPPRAQRCAIYTRKSTEHNLDLAFNSLDAQREACEAYIKSQAHEPWRLVPGHYDDGGLSGASLDRPALQRLLDDVRGRRVDIIVVYKVDRLTRALADFAKLVELFDENEVSFVSVTQSFNTTSSMGRLTLNVLLSFAQFEREVIGERVRDKIAASKRKGIWVGGPVPLGYRCENKAVLIAPAEAEIVRTIFARYLVLKSVGLLVAELDRDGVRSRTGFRIGVGALAHLLRNRFYVGEVAYRGEIHPGPQPPIVDRTLFDAVQAQLDAQAIERRERADTSAGLLTGLLHDDRGNRLTPSHTNKRGVRYRYYVSQAVLQNQKNAVTSIKRIAAHDIEQAVIKTVRAWRASADGTSDRDLIVRYVRSVIVKDTSLKITVWDLGGDPNEQHAEHDAESASQVEPPKIVLTVPWIARRTRCAKHLQGSATTNLSDHDRLRLLIAIGKAKRWMSDVDDKLRTFEDIAIAEDCVERHIRFLAPLAYLSPRIIQAIDDCSAPSHWTVSLLARALPHDWTSQEASLGLRS